MPLPADKAGKHIFAGQPARLPQMGGRRHAAKLDIRRERARFRELRTERGKKKDDLT
jgi:hypothetical protein